MEPGQPVAGRPIRFNLSGLPSWKRFTVTFLNPLSSPADWTDRDETFLRETPSQRVRTATLLSDEKGSASFARLNSLDTEGQWTIEVNVDGVKYVGRYTLLPLQLDVSPSNELGVDMRRYAGGFSEVYSSAGVPLSLALDLGGYIPLLTEKIKPWLGLTSVQIPNLYLFSSQELFTRAMSATGATNVSPFVGGIYRPSGRFRGVYVIANAFNAETTMTLTHEYVHLLVQETASRATVPAWLNEGLAKYLESHLTLDFGSGLRPRREIYESADLVKSRNASNTLIPLGKLVSQRDWNAQPDRALATLQYAEAYMAVRYLTERFGNASVGLIIGELAKDQSFEAAFTTVSGITLAEFEQDWLKWLAQWQDLTREQVRNYLVKVEEILKDTDAISTDRSAFLNSPAGSGPFALRVPAQTEFANRAAALEGRGAALTPPTPLRELNSDLTSFLSTYKKWLQLEVDASRTSSNALVSQANAMIPEIDGRRALLRSRSGSLSFNYQLGSQ